MRILAIETSCDDTGIAILEVSNPPAGGHSFTVLANIISSQIEIHKKYGGVYPMMAKREHQLNLVPVLIKALKETKLNTKETKNKVKPEELNAILEREPELAKQLIPFLQETGKPDIDLIAVTQGPGLEPCLWVGINFARALSYFWDIPIIPVNHIESHILVNYLNNPKIKLPALALVVSGGHTQIILMKNPPAGGGKYEILGETRDDAAGECFDKCAKILGLEYPGGPVISKLAEDIKADGLLPRPMINTKDYDFSFSGLKTAVLYSWQKDQSMGTAKMAAEVQQAIIDVLVKKTIKAAKDYKVKTIILGGGVSANKELKKQLKEKIEQEIPNTDYLFPQIDHSTDNGLMTAVAGYFHHNKKVSWKKLRADANLRIG